MFSKKMNSNATGVSSAAATGCDVRPGGMLVQQRNSDPTPVPNIRIKVKHGSSDHQVTISSQATFGELKNAVAGLTGVYPQDQRLTFKDEERNSKAFLDTCGVRDGSKIALAVDEVSRERRLVESRRNAKMEKASKDITAVRIQVDSLAKQLASIELGINGGKQVVETCILKLIELLMAQLIQLDGIAADGDVKSQRRMQIKNAGLGKVHGLRKKVNTGPIAVTTKWETF